MNARERVPNLSESDIRRLAHKQNVDHDRHGYATYKDGCPMCDLLRELVGETEEEPENVMRAGLRWRTRAMKAEETIAEIHKVLQQGWAASTNLLAQAIVECLEDFEEEPADA